MNPSDEAISLIRAAQRIAVATHEAPDGDAIGSLLAMARILESMGKQVALLCADSPPARLRFLPGSDAIRATLDDFEPELLIGLDANDASRLGKTASALVEAGLPTVNLDHHVTNDNYGSVNWVGTHYVATTEAVLELLDALDVPLDEETALCLLTGLVTDTRGFRTANVTPHALAVASRLMQAGADLPYIVRHTLDYATLSDLKLVGDALRRMHLEGNVIWSSLPFSRRKAEASVTGLSSMLLGVEGARISAVFREKADGRVDLSLRAEPGYDVATVATELGGGGHALAAGATVDGPLDDAVVRALKLLKQAANPDEQPDA